MASIFMSKQRLLLSKLFISFVPILFAALMLYLKIARNDFYRAIIHEDAIIENLTSIAYFAAFIFALTVSVGFLRRKYLFRSLAYLILSLGFFFVSMEEISWGQRIFHIGTPKFVEKYNVQKENNIHNLSLIKPFLGEMYILTGLIGCCSWLFIGNNIRRKYNGVVEYFVPGWYLSPYFLFIVLITGYMELLDKLPWLKPRSSTFFRWTDSEPAELLLSLGFLLFVIVNRYKQHRMDWRQSAQM
jgi:hypothetical protein